MDIKKQIGLKVKARRKGKKLSQLDLGTMSKTSRETVINIEAGKSNVEIETLEKIAEALDCGIEFDLKNKK